jgi:hypothetical protein
VRHIRLVDSWGWEISEAFVQYTGVRFADSVLAVLSEHGSLMHALTRSCMLISNTQALVICCSLRINSPVLLPRMTSHMQKLADIRMSMALVFKSYISRRKHIMSSLRNAQYTSYLI